MFAENIRAVSFSSSSSLVRTTSAMLRKSCDEAFICGISGITPTLTGEGISCVSVKRMNPRKPHE